MPSEIILRKLEKTHARTLGKGVEVPDVKEFIRYEAEDEWKEMKDAINKLQEEVDAREAELVTKMMSDIHEKKLERFKEWLPKHKERKERLKRAKLEAAIEAEREAEEYALRHIKMEEDQK